MSESIWWREEFWWEQKSIPLGPLSLSPRQLATISAFAVLGLAVSLIVSFPVAGISFGGKAVVFLVCLAFGYILSKKRVKMVPMELQLVYMLRSRGETRKVKSGKKKQTLVSKESEEAEAEMVVDDFKSLAPLSVAGRIPVRKQSKALLLVDGKQRDEVVVSPDVPDYRFVFKPGPADIGTHEVTIMVEGSNEPEARLRLVVRKQGVEMLEAKQ